MKTFLSVLLILPLITACATPQHIYWDSEVDRLCAIDGGVKVYETVTLPPDKFDEKYGQINFYRPTQGKNALGPEYIFEWDRHNYTKGDPARGAQEVASRRNHFRIIRKSDMKLLGEFVLYSRVGGDLPGPWAPSSYRCPGLEVNEIGLMNQVFIKSIEGNGK